MVDEARQSKHALSVGKNEGGGEAIKGEAVPLVVCRKLNPRAQRTLVACQGCDQYGGIDEVMPEQNGRPAYYQIICKLPARVDVTYLIKEEG